MLACLTSRTIPQSRGYYPSLSKETEARGSCVIYPRSKRVQGRKNWSPASSDGTAREDLAPVRCVVSGLGADES